MSMKIIFLIISLGCLTFLVLDSRHWNALKNKYTRWKLSKIKDIPLSENHPEYYNWQKGDQIVYKRGLGDVGSANILTFSRYTVIAMDPDSETKITLYGDLIIENPTYDLRKKWYEAEKFQEQILPEITKALPEEQVHRGSIDEIKQKAKKKTAIGG